MLNIRQRWAEIRQIEATITDNEPFVISIEDRRREMVGGLTVQVGSREIAAKLIFDGTHRLAIPEEVAKHKESDLARVTDVRGEQLRKAGFGTFVLPPAKPATKESKS